MTTPEAMRSMVAEVDRFDARLAAFEGVAPLPWASEDMEEIASTIDEFLGDRPPPRVYFGPGKPPDEVLTGREIGVLKLVASGLSNKEIAQELSLSVHTVQRHIANTYGKIGARGPADATCLRPKAPAALVPGYASEHL
jgi:DNA-binding NarL/FixJ family response regulator